MFVERIPSPYTSYDSLITINAYKHSILCHFNSASKQSILTMQLLFTTLDVFTQTRYVGNPLGVVRVPSSLRPKLTEQQKQAIAAEFNLSEITFLHDVQPGEDFAYYDIFTPRSRMSFAGHPTIGTALYLAKHAGDYAGVKKLKTVAGEVPFVINEKSGVAEVSVPHDVYVHRERLLRHPLPGEETNPSGEETVPLVSIVKGMAFNLVPLKTLEALGSVSQGLIPVASVFKGEHLDPGSGWDVGYTGTFYYCDLGTDQEDAERRLIRTRSIGTREDPGTGSASSALCCYLALQEGKHKGKGPFKFHLTQGVEMGRRCDIFVDVTRREDGAGIEDVKLSGTAVEVMEGVLRVDE
jgi:predicted PhzF superfamily epimerase YddE/YHI9